MNIIIVGCGKVGTTLAEELSNEGTHDITIIDLDRTKLQGLADNYDVMGITGNGTSFSTLQEAGIDTADIFIAVTESDELNLLCCVIAKKSHSKLATIARVRSHAYHKEIGYLRDSLGISMIINPELAAATEISRLLRFPNAIEISTFAKGRVELMTFRINDKNPMIDMSLSNVVSQFKTGIVVCAVERDHQVFIPDGNFVFQTNDTVSIVGTPKNSSDFFKKIKIKTHQVHNTMIVGGGTTAVYLAWQLLSMGIDVKIIEKDMARCHHLCELLPEAMIIHGEGINHELLMEEGLEECESFVSLTGFDEENLFLSMFAGSKTKGKLVTKINRLSYDEVIARLDLGSIVCPKQLTAQYITQYVRSKQNSLGSNVENIHRILENKADALEFHIQETCPLIGITFEKMQLRSNIIVAAIIRGNNIVIPRGHDSFQAGDHVVLVSSGNHITDIMDILKNRSSLDAK